MSEAPGAGPVLDVAHIVEVLNRHGVDYVVIGGVAAAAWAASQGVELRPTEDVDITPHDGRANLDRLSAALTELEARVRTVGVPEGLAFAHDGASLGRATIWNLISKYGPFDIALRPQGTDGFDDLAQHATVVEVDGVATPLADLADIIRSKRAANRPKDHETLPALEEALRRRDETPPGGRPDPPEPNT